MTIWTVVRATSKTSFGWGTSILSKFRISVLLIIFAIILIQAGMISFQERSVAPGLKLIGDKLLLPTNIINEASLKLIEDQQIITVDGGFFKNTWTYIKLYWIFVENIVIIYFWIKLFSLLFLGIMGDTSKGPIAFILAIGLFFMFQMLTIVYFVEDSVIMDPFMAFYHFGQAFPILFEPFYKLADKWS